MPKHKPKLEDLLARSSSNDDGVDAAAEVASTTPTHLTFPEIKQLQARATLLAGLCRQQAAILDGINSKVETSLTSKTSPLLKLALTKKSTVLTELAKQLQTIATVEISNGTPTITKIIEALVKYIGDAQRTITAFPSNESGDNLQGTLNGKGGKSRDWAQDIAAACAPCSDAKIEALLLKAQANQQVKQEKTDVEKRLISGVMQKQAQRLDASAKTAPAPQQLHIFKVGDRVIITNPPTGVALNDIKQAIVSAVKPGEVTVILYDANGTELASAPYDPSYLSFISKPESYRY